MTLEEAIIQEGLKQEIKMAQLYKPASMCYDNPSMGITIQAKEAEFVIRDCALMTKQYLPVEIFKRLDDPIISLRKKVKSEELKKFAQAVHEGEISKRVLYDSIFSYKKQEVADKRKKPKSLQDVYGDYTELLNRHFPSMDKSYEFHEVVRVVEGLLL